MYELEIMAGGFAALVVTTSVLVSKCLIKKEVNKIDKELEQLKQDFSTLKKDVKKLTKG